MVRGRLTTALHAAAGYSAPKGHSVLLVPFAEWDWEPMGAQGCLRAAPSWRSGLQGILRVPGPSLLWDHPVLAQGEAALHKELGSEVWEHSVIHHCHAFPQQRTTLSGRASLAFK